MNDPRESLSDRTVNAIRAAASGQLRAHPEISNYLWPTWIAVLAAAQANVARAAQEPDTEHARVILVDALIALATDAAMWLEVLEIGAPRVRRDSPPWREPRDYTISTEG